ncbi:MAG: nitrogen fixation protein FixI [Novosphingobium sp. 17-62-19]|uniref:heavy metal translocating P-type ATPase n=1 Tax=Novosphingobium sp. 17-62-19 TaxID=1970406 RepID=UPI000BD928FC|nr:heavy metal translocating P-type ATPase [Novosphingobium sp. 17-62-19]OZA21331.1 MAG: nitrogen fixation protein FixI [Novosphingobium sp. 17-62-19]HQS95637.1 heavy metal translocating P-type ATPase [Novosphingobium sp.]
MTAPARNLAIPDDTIHTVLAVPGMHCAGCMGKVERALSAVEGVASARTNLTARTVEVVHTPRLETPVLIAALAATGFDAQPREIEAEPVSAVKPLLAPLGVAAFACMNVMLMSVSVWSGADGTTRSLFHWVSALIGVPAIVYAGRPFFASAWKVLRHGKTNMDVPISIGVTIATGLSFYETLTGGAEAWFDGVLMLLMFLLAGRVLDAMMRDRARSGVDALLRQVATGTMVVAADGATRWLDTKALQPGMLMRVAAGERLAADGEVLRGQTRFDLSLLTGESAPVQAAPGTLVHAGTLNVDAPVDVRVTAIGQDTALSEIARLMEVAGQSRSKYVRIADRAARLYAPAVHTLAALTFAGWMMAGAGWYQSLVIAIAVLIITCPCALGLAVPVAQVVAAGALLKKGVLVKDGSALERMAEVDRILIDKTGTLTLGRPVPDEVALGALTPFQASVALALASYSRHPLSLGLAQALGARGIHAAALEDVAEETGQGVTARWNGLSVALGRPASAQGMATALRIQGDPVRIIPFADRLRPDAEAALARLKDLRVEASILSGDSVPAVAAVARATCLTAQAAASPAEKQEAIQRLQNAGRKVMMAGDGLNDGPALAAAHASIAPGSASDVGRQAADMVFTADSLLAIPRAIRVSRQTMRVVRQNFVLAIGYNLLAVPLAILGHVTPLIAAAAMSTSSLIVVANSLRLVREAK